MFLKFGYKLPFLMFMINICSTSQHVRAGNRPYSFVHIQISPSCLVLMLKTLKNIFTFKEARRAYLNANNKKSCIGLCIYICKGMDKEI